jgi:hypothetical protein
MTPKRWLAIVVLIALAATAAVAGSSYALDIFGVFRNPKGRSLSVQYNERTGKSLLNLRYVPANFDAVVIGGSSTTNWDMHDLTFAHFYNESIYGSNMVEEKALVDDALPRAHFRYAVCVISPYLFGSHALNEGSLTPSRINALGSLNLFREEAAMLADRLRHRPAPFWPDGGRPMPPSHNEGDPFLDYSFDYDPVALQAFADLLNELRARGTKIIFVDTPIYGPPYRKHQAQFERFYNEFSLRRPGEPMITFDGPRYASIVENPADWVDAPHTTDAVSEQLSQDFNRRVLALIASGQLR